MAGLVLGSEAALIGNSLLLVAGDRDWQSKTPNHHNCDKRSRLLPEEQGGALCEDAKSISVLRELCRGF